MFRAMMSQQQQQQQQMQGNPGPQLYQHSVASTLAQIGVDPGYYSDSECSSNSSDKVNEEGNVSPPQNKLSRIPEQQIQQPNANYNCFNDYFGFNESLVKPMPLRYPDSLVLGAPGTPSFESPTSGCWKDQGGWKAVESPAKDSAVSEGGESVEEHQLYTPATSPPSTVASPPSLVTVKKGNGKRNKVQVCVFCRNNGEDESVYSTHALKSPDGKVTCPILFAYECPICRSTGENAHTLKYCPRNPNGQGHMPAQNGGGQNAGYSAGQGYSGSSNMGYGNSSSRSTSQTGQSAQFNSNLMQAMIQMAQMNGGNLHPALAQLNFNMAAMLYQQQMGGSPTEQQQQQQPSNPFAEWVQQQQQQQQYGGENKNYSQSYNSQSNYGGYNNNNTSNNTSNNYNSSYSTQSSYPGYSSYNDVYNTQHSDPYSAPSTPYSTSNTPYSNSNTPSSAEVDNNLSQLFGKASIDDFLQNYSR
ncbi:hypothetical protein ACHWQZ_G008887 [Mnemiopsis leidyi]